MKALQSLFLSLLLSMGLASAGSWEARFRYYNTPNKRKATFKDIYEVGMDRLSIHPHWYLSYGAGVGYMPSRFISSTEFQFGMTIPSPDEVTGLIGIGPDLTYYGYTPDNAQGDAAYSGSHRASGVEIGLFKIKAGAIIGGKAELSYALRYNSTATHIFNIGILF